MRELARKHSIDLKESHSKSRGLDIAFMSQPYLQCKQLSLYEKQLLFRLRTYTYDCKRNFPNQFGYDTNCYSCPKLDSQEHLLDCKIADGIDIKDVKFSNIFGSLKEQINLTKTLVIIDQRRKQR